MAPGRFRLSPTLSPRHRRHPTSRRTNCRRAITPLVILSRQLAVLLREDHFAPPNAPRPQWGGESIRAALRRAVSRLRRSSTSATAALPSLRAARSVQHVLYRHRQRGDRRQRDDEPERGRLRCNAVVPNRHETVDLPSGGSKPGRSSIAALPTPIDEPYHPNRSFHIAAVRSGMPLRRMPARARPTRSGGEGACRFAPRSTVVVSPFPLEGKPRGVPALMTDWSVIALGRAPPGAPEQPLPCRACTTRRRHAPPTWGRSPCFHWTIPSPTPMGDDATTD